ncbi:hypothetical protein BDEG_26869 [Batrachochytrium dendrobatidis JEL423]|uniref:Uncharacterized protein n=1 Tax=Batrachochytrium dendrobatidis (strain JEL423) TaxID=403673 RepID=A0A177WUE0_BATDL|nr:hypothetical protein BDEG_26869 [Batrachochytrium dendrobatidis JEL423]
MGDKQQHTSDRPQYPSEPFNINSNQINGDRIQPRKSSLTFSPATMSGLKSIGEQQQKQQSTPPLLQQMPYRRPTNDKSSSLKFEGGGSSQRPATPPNAASRSQSHYPSSPSISSPLLSESFADQPNSKYSITVESTTIHVKSVGFYPQD